MPLTLLEAAKSSGKLTAGRTRHLWGSEEVQEVLQERSASYDPDTSLATGCEGMHANPILQRTGGTLEGNEQTHEQQGGHFLPEQDINHFYDQGFVDQNFQLAETGYLGQIFSEYNQYKEGSLRGSCPRDCNRFPEYIAHFYLPHVAKLLKDNYDTIVAQAMSLLNVPEEELFFSVLPFVVDRAGAGINLHQDHSYFTQDQGKEEIETSVLSFHVSLVDDSTSRLFLFPKTHEQIMHNLNALQYLLNQGVECDPELVKMVRCVTDHLVETKAMPYEGGDLNLRMPHVTRHFQQLAVQQMYADCDIQGRGVATKPGEYFIFDPALQHANGHTGTSGKFAVFAEGSGSVNRSDVARFSLAIRVLSGREANGNLLWFSVDEQTAVLQQFFDQLCEGSGVEPFDVGAGGETFKTVLANNKLKEPGYFSVDNMYQMHLRSGAYGVVSRDEDEDEAERGFACGAGSSGS